MLRLVLSCMALFLAAPIALAQDSPASSAPAAPVPATTVRVKLETSEGPIVLALEKDRAPVTTANFLHYVDQKRFDGIGFYRAMTIAPGTGLIQAGIRDDTRKLFPPIKHEPTSQTGLTHDDMAISMARYQPGSATSDFFITVGAIPSMDADPKQPGDNLGFAAFGHVVEGMDIVRHILAEPVSVTEGEGAMKGQMLAQPVKIVTARRVP